MKNLKIISILLVLILTFGFLTCTKGKEKGSSDTVNQSQTLNNDSINNGANGSSGSDNDNNSDGGNGIKITINNIPNELPRYEYSRYDIILSVEDAEWGTLKKIAIGSGKPLEDSKSFDIDLFDFEWNPWTKTGDYYVEFSDSDKSLYFTDGKEMEALGISSDRYGDVYTEDLIKLPTYSLKTSGNTIDYSKFKSGLPPSKRYDDELLEQGWTRGPDGSLFFEGDH